MSTPRAPAAKRALTQNDSRLTLRRNPVALVCSASLWRSAGYLGSDLIVGSGLFAVALSTGVVAAFLGFTVVAVPLLIAAAEVIRGCATVERGMLRQVFAEPVHADYPAPRGDGLWKRARARWGGGTTWRDLAWLVGMWPAQLALSVAVLAVWGTFLAGITLPIWYWAPRGSEMAGYVHGAQVHGVAIGYFPHGAAGPGAAGLYVDTLPKALLAAVVFAVLFLLFNYVLVATARLHAQVARAMLQSSADPLAPAKAVLTGAGPLGPLVGTELSGQGRPDDRLLR
jgi:Putative sensor